jgi:predicted metal-dependent hydrolase
MHQMTVDGLTIDIVRKNIKHVRLTIHPLEGRIRVSAPLRASDEAVRSTIMAKLGWIKRQHSKFQTQELQSPPTYITDESHYFQGACYRLNVINHNGPGRVVIRNNETIDLFVCPDSTVAQRERVLAAWYRAYLKQALPPLIVQWENVIGVQVADWGVKQMRTKWGSCSITARRVWLNLELAKRPPCCLEYVLVHEIVHLLERRHNRNFWNYMDRFMPEWRRYRELLNHGLPPAEGAPAG